MNAHDHYRLLDALTWLCAGVTVISLQQTAMVVAILSGLASLILFGIRIHDRVKYGPAKERAE